MRKTKTQEEALERVREVWGDHYDLTPFVYKGRLEKVKVICPEHGEFEIRAYSLFKGSGCNKCAQKIRIAGIRNRREIKTKEQFILKSRQVHGWKFDYSKVEYVDGHTKVCIICPIHGEFWMAPYNHMRGQGCPECGGVKKKDTARFIQDARKVHGDEYDYSPTEYINAKTKVKINCRIHGEFEQRPNDHLNGQGCAICKKSHGEREIARFLINHKIEFISQYKISPEQSLFGHNTIVVDFFLPTLNTIIEYNGRQHYEMVRYWHKIEEGFAEQQDRDRRLRQHCKSHKIILIEIPYSEFKNIDKILTKKLK